MAKEKVINFCQRKKLLNTDFSCCEQFHFHLYEKERIVVYESYFRRYLLRSNYWEIATIYFCPWCGATLPGSLREKFFDTLESDFDIITNIGEYKTQSNIPQEFRSDEWWKKRNL